MRITATAEFMLEPILEPNKDQGTSRDAIGIGQVAGKGLNTRHGTILTLEDISVSFDGFKALNDLNLYIGVGELRCIIGPNGAGKSTTVSILTGLTMPTGGGGTLLGHDIRTQMHSVYSAMGVCPQFDILWPSLTVEETMLFYVRLKGCPAAHERAAARHLTRTVTRATMRRCDGTVCSVVTPFRRRRVKRWSCSACRPSTS